MRGPLDFNQVLYVHSEVQSYRQKQCAMSAKEWLFNDEKLQRDVLEELWPI